MLKKKLPLLISFVILAGSSAIAADACKPGDIALSVDRFTSQPYNATAWRVLHGLGDPKVEGSGWDDSNWQSIDAWKKLVADLAPSQIQAQEPGYDCRMSYPLKVLNDRINSFGKTSPYINQWIMAQSRVIAACSGTEKANFDLPSPVADLPPDQTAIQNFDRDYQTASVAFYKDKAKAVELFRAVAASASPHKAYARYNIANLLANNKDVVGARAEAKSILADPALSSVHSITQALLGYIANLEDTPAGWTDLIDHTLDVLSKPEAEIMASEKLKADYAHAIYDIGYAGMTAKRDDWWVKGELPENPTLSKALVDEARKSPMALWMMTGQSVDQNYQSASWALVGDKWNGWAVSYVDRALALSPANVGISGSSKDLLDILKAKSDDQTRKDIWVRVDTAEKSVATSCGNSPEAAAVGQMLLHAVRLSALAGKFDEAYAGLNASSLKGSEIYTNTIVYKLAQYVLATGNAEEGRRLRDHVLTPGFFASVALDKQEQLKANYSDFLQWVAEDEATWRKAAPYSNAKLGNPIFNLLPAQQLKVLSTDRMFSESQRALLARVAWTRAYGMGQKLTQAETQTMFAINPKLKASYDDVAREFPKLNENRRLLLTILRNPRFGILVNSPDSYSEPIEAERDVFAAVDEYDHNDKNWWCPLEPGRQLHAQRAAYDSGAGVIGDVGESLKPAYDQSLADKIAAAREALLKQHPMIKMVSKRDLQALADMPSAPAKLTKAAIAWGKGSDGKDGAPEALALAVKLTRYGCNWHGGHKSYSKPAQELLNSKFADSAWAKATPYWFDCVAEVYDKDFKKVKSCKPQAWPKDELPK